MSVIVKEARATVEIHMRDSKVAQITYTNGLTLDRIATIRDDATRREITFYQDMPSNVTIEEFDLTSPEFFKYSIIHLASFLRKVGYRTVTIFVYNEDKKLYESVGFKQVEYIEDLNMWFMMKTINL